ncbi:hypothetical protein GSI_14871 [Ganoderma sinense ZZ0214-1]|uniref:Uncharacterized protein n=1 Tax=Ganoderma sinense ZZ0214-1 TaxID=1077348 RepID=A0A2G8RQD6_9APHY|nr:hypothetical protein GSI_14871 [Ganoderma sinense ZZ0214-1]
MASWVLAHPPWHSLARVRLRWDMLANAGGWMRTGRHFLNTPTLSLAVDLNEETPAMREMKAYPYPSSRPDASLFEDTDEYATVSIAREEEKPALFDIPAGSPPCTLLKHLVQAGRYEDAERVHAELKELNVEIHPHPVYHFIARKILSTPDLAPQKRLEDFVKWWSLVPDTNDLATSSKDRVPATKNLARSVGFILSEILRKDHVPDIPLIANFALLAVSKGYATQVAQDVIYVISRYAPPGFTQHFLEEFCISEWKHETKKTVHEHRRCRADTLTKFHFRAWYSGAILSHIDCGRQDSALQLLELAASRNIWVTQHTYRRFISSLAAIGRLKDARVVRDIRRRQNFVRGTDKDPFVPFARSPSGRCSIRIVVPSSGDRVELAKSARSIKHALHRRLSISAPRLAKVFLTFLASRQHSILHRLRNLAYRSGPSAISSWVLAEMIYYSKPYRNHPASFLRVFEQHFHHVGVPSEIFNPVFSSEHRFDLAKVNASAVGLHQVGPAPPIRRRLAPTREHMYLLWKAVVENAQRPATVARLYREFVDAVTSSLHVPQNVYPLPRLVPYTRPNPAPSSKPQDASVEYLKPIPLRILYDTRIFHVFIDKFLSFGFLTHATRVVLDMFRLQSVPNAVTLNKFAEGLRFKPDLAAVERRLEYWEKAATRALRWPLDVADHPVQHDSVDATEERILMFFYRATVRNLVREGRREDAVLVAARFLELFPAGPTDQKTLEQELLKPSRVEMEAGLNPDIGTAQTPPS